MKSFARWFVPLASCVLSLTVASGPAVAQQTATVDGIVVHLGIVPAEVALRADGHREAHPPNPPPGAQHLLVTLDDRATGKRIADAEVLVEVTDPRGHVEKKPMLHTQAGGLPDYSELVHFGWDGQYAIRVVITPRGVTKPVETVFKVDHTI